MHRLSVLARFVLIAAIFGGFATGCTKEFRKNRLLKNAESDFKAGAYDKAKIEYLSALRLGTQDATTFARIGQIWFDEGAPLKAAAFLNKAKELNPNDLENRLRLAQVYDAVGKRDDSKKEVLFVLQHAPANAHALLLLTQTALTRDELDSAEQAVRNFPQKDSVGYYLAGANLAMRKMDVRAAQELIDKAIATDPKSAEAHRSRAILLLMQKKPQDAVAEFKTAAELSPARSSMKISYPDFLAQSGDRAGATAYLKELTKNTPDFLPAWILLARTALAEKKADEALAVVENVFSRDPDNVEARVIQADAFLTKQQTKKAVEILDALDKSHPGAPLIKYQLARVYLQDHNPTQAAKTLNEAITARPNYADAILLLAEINLRSGQAEQAVSPLEELVNKQGDRGRAALLLADAYRSVGRLDDAAAIFQQRIKEDPKNADDYIFLGVIQEEQKKTAEARNSFEKALQLAPDNLLPLSKLIDLDLKAGDFDSATRRVEAQMQKAPNSGSSYLLRGKVLTAKKDLAGAEVALKKAVELDPNLGQAYDLLVAIYLETGKGDQAIQELEGVVAKSPENKAALLTLGSIQEKKGNYEKVREAYEKVLAVDPNDITALNNLAYLYADRLNQPQKGLDLARKAQNLAPTSPVVTDTLGWALFRRDEYQQAVTLLEDSATKVSDNPEAQFHLGMAHYMMGKTDAARADFERALKLEGDFPSKQEAERRLELLQQTEAGTGKLSVGQLEAMLKEHPKDVVARVRLAELYRAQNQFDQAAAAYQEALKSNPNLLDVTRQLAELYLGPLKDPQKALEFAKKARDLAPSDPHVAEMLGRVALATGNFEWSYSLLQESARQLSSDPNVLHNLAWAAYSLGKIDQARQAAQRSASASPATNIASDDKLFLLLTDPGAPAAKPEIDAVLQKDPIYAPALMAAAALDVQGEQTKAAEDRYRAVLDKFPLFTPAQKQLALLYAKDPSRSQEAYDLAVKARKTFPDDVALARALGQLSYERKEYPRAVQFLQESGRKAPLDAEGLLYLGLSYKEMRRPAEAKKTLQSALAANLSTAQADEAKRALSDLGKP